MPDNQVLDVGTGIGNLIPDFRFFGVTGIVGCDISSAMLAEAQARFPEIDFWCGDVIDLPQKFGLFDVVFCNAMFGNVCNQRQTLEAIRSRLTVNGRIIISHPMGAVFQAQLKRENSQLVPHLLPNRERLNELVDGLALQVHHFYDEDQLYLCCLQQSYS
jgi:2-polyprenyl-3-methyl-5-hydroxy-6-metoxy-1,4-benzoquinol methylase